MRSGRSPESLPALQSPGWAGLIAPQHPRRVWQIQFGCFVPRCTMAIMYATEEKESVPSVKSVAKSNVTF